MIGLLAILYFCHCVVVWVSVGRRSPGRGVGRWGVGRLCHGALMRCLGYHPCPQLCLRFVIGKILYLYCGMAVFLMSPWFEARALQRLC